MHTLNFTCIRSPSQQRDSWGCEQLPTLGDIWFGSISYLDISPFVSGSILQLWIATYIYTYIYTYMYKFLPSCNQTWQWTNPHNGKRSINGTFPIAMFGCWRVSQNMATGYALTFPPSLRTWNIPNPSQNSKRSMGDFPICGSVLK